MHRYLLEIRLTAGRLGMVLAGAALGLGPLSSAASAGPGASSAAGHGTDSFTAAPAGPGAASTTGQSTVPTSPAVASSPHGTLPYPASRTVDVVDTLFGTPVKDPYRWLEDASSPEVQQWMADQDKLARDVLHSLPGRDALARRLRELFYIDAISPPKHRGNRYFYQRSFADREKSVYFWREGEKGPEQVLLDPNTLSKDGSVSVGDFSVALDGRRVAYVLHPNNADEGTIQVMDVATGKVLEGDSIPGVMWTMAAWSPAGDGFYYTWLPPKDPKVAPPDRMGLAEIRFHALGTSPATDRVIYPSLHDPTKWLEAQISRDGHWLFINVENDSSDIDVYYRDTRSKDPAFKPLAVGMRATNQVIAWKDRFYLFTDLEAPRGRVFVIDPKQPARDHWKEIVPEAKERVLQDVGLVGGHLVLNWSHNASSELEIRALDGKPVHQVQLPGIGMATGMLGNPDEDVGYFMFSSLVHPPEVYETSIKTGGTRLWTAVKVPVDPSPYTLEQVWYPSKDGTKVSMFLVHRKDMPRDGSTPFYLTGYGGFTISQYPVFRSAVYAWLEAGGGFALPNLRGGGEYGEDWHRAGMLDRKQNVFDDFIGAAEYLVKSGYTRPERLANEGGSNGGLLTGAMITQRPDLFGAVVCAVPLLDMVRYHLFGTGKAWVSEYGSSEDAAQFRTLHAYSPYHHVTPGTAYPPVLMMSADSDDRVDPMHARKFTAALQSSSSSDRPIILRIESNSGHTGGDQKKKYVEEYADEYAFIMHALGMAPPGGAPDGGGAK